jgi:hypothetical protein
MAEENKSIEELLNSEENLNKAIAFIKEKGNTVMSNSDFEENKSNIKKEIGSSFGVKLSQIDETLKDLGFEKESNEATEKFSERISKQLKGDNDTLRKQREEGLTGAEGLTAENRSLLERLNTSAIEKEELENNFKTTLTNKDKEHLVSKAISSLKFKEEFAEVVLTPAKDQFIKDVLNTSTLEEGKLVFKDTDGVTKRNEKNEPITVLELANKKFESILDNSTKKEGVHAENQGNSIKSSLSSFAASRKPTNFADIDATVRAFYKQNNEKIVNGSRRYNKDVTELRKAYNI